MPVARFFMKVVPSDATSSMTVQKSMLPPPLFFCAYKIVCHTPPMMEVALGTPTSVTKEPMVVGVEFDNDAAVIVVWVPVLGTISKLSATGSELVVAPSK